jgi:hypothetical protein
VTGCDLLPVAFIEPDALDAVVSPVGIVMPQSLRDACSRETSRSRFGRPDLRRLEQYRVLAGLMPASQIRSRYDRERCSAPRPIPNISPAL